MALPGPDLADHIESQMHHVAMSNRQWHPRPLAEASGLLLLSLVSARCSSALPAPSISDRRPVEVELSLQQRGRGHAQTAGTGCQVSCVCSSGCMGLMFVLPVLVSVLMRRLSTLQHVEQLTGRAHDLPVTARKTVTPHAQASAGSLFLASSRCVCSSSSCPSCCILRGEQFCCQVCPALHGCHAL